MKKNNVWQKIKMWINDLLFPENIKCIFCGVDVPHFEDRPYCDDCEKKISFNNKNKCTICAEPIDNEATVCDVCQKTKRYFKKAFCPFVYEGIVRNAILGFKDSNRRYMAKTFAKYIAKEIVDAKIKIDIITFVPMTKKKTRERSFNQSKLLAEEVGKIFDLPVVALFEKTRDNKAQKYLTAKERSAAIDGLYVFNKTKLESDVNVLIVDDIITTGSTINYCASLIEKKVKGVYAAAIARNKKSKPNN